MPANALTFLPATTSTSAGMSMFRPTALKLTSSTVSFWNVKPPDRLTMPATLARAWPTVALTTRLAAFSVMGLPPVAMAWPPPAEKSTMYSGLLLVLTSTSASFSENSMNWSKPTKAICAAEAFNAVNFVPATMLVAGFSTSGSALYRPSAKSKSLMTRPMAFGFEPSPPTPTKACTSLAPISMARIFTSGIVTPSGPLTVRRVSSALRNAKLPSMWTNWLMVSRASVRLAAMTLPDMSSTTGAPPVGTLKPVLPPAVKLIGRATPLAVLTSMSTPFADSSKSLASKP